jgi:hypothetical protein
MLNCCRCLHSILSVITHEINVSGHMLIRTFFLVLVCGTRVQNLSAPFSYTPYISNSSSFPTQTPILQTERISWTSVIIKLDVADRERLFWSFDSPWRLQILINPIVTTSKDKRNLATHVAKARIQVSGQPRNCIVGHRLHLSRTFKFAQGVFLVARSRQLTGPDGRLLFLIPRTLCSLSPPMASRGVCTQ